MQMARPKPDFADQGDYLARAQSPLKGPGICLQLVTRYQGLVIRRLVWAVRDSS